MRNETNDTTRRNLLIGLPALGAMAALPAPAAAVADDPIMPLYREWKVARIAWLKEAKLCESGNYDSPQCEAENERWEKAHAALIASKPISLEGAAALLHVLWDVSDAPSDRTDLEAKLNEPAYALMASLWQFLTGTDSYPPAEDMQPFG
ncbi:MAG: hypothetical protein VXW58_18735 [Pseudomonadota bacterium]|nr:hypothetical protein [Pseudomonadota bacterium]